MGTGPLEGNGTTWNLGVVWPWPPTAPMYPTPIVRQLQFLNKSGPYTTHHTCCNPEKIHGCSRDSVSRPIMVASGASYRAYRGYCVDLLRSTEHVREMLVRVIYSSILAACLGLTGMPARRRPSRRRKQKPRPRPRPKQKPRQESWNYLKDQVTPQTLHGPHTLLGL